MTTNEKARPAGTGSDLDKTPHADYSPQDVTSTTPAKSDVDLASWAALGKPSRERRMKAKWQRGRK